MTQGVPVWDLLGPPRCVGCGCRGGLLCTTCRDRLQEPARDDLIPGVDRCLAAWQYEGPARDLVLALKLRGIRPAAETLAEAVVRTTLRRGIEASVLTWVPGRGPDIRRRGFDHAALIAAALGTWTGLPVRRLLWPALRTADQSGLGGAERRANLRGAFWAAPCPAAVAVVDDVVTTGATAGAAAEALRAAGAGRVEVLAACRA